MEFQLSTAAAATVAGLVAEDDELQEIVGNEEGPNSEAIIAPDQVWKEIREAFPLELFAEHGDWIDRDAEERASVCPECSSEDFYKSDLRAGAEFRCNNCGEYFNEPSRVDS